MLLSKGSSGSGGAAAAASAERGQRNKKGHFRNWSGTCRYKTLPASQYWVKSCVTVTDVQAVSLRVSDYKMKAKKCGWLCKYFNRFLKGQHIYIFTHADEGGLWRGISYGGRLRYPQQSVETHWCEKPQESPREGKPEV